jgi:hypothetical protein
MKPIVLVSLLFALHSTVIADTATMRSNNSLNGTVVGLQERHLVLRAGFGSGVKELQIPRTEIKSIEFNRSVFNPGPPPAYYQARPPGERERSRNDQSKPAATTSDEPGDPEVGDVVVLKSGGTRKCGVAQVDSTSVHCGGEAIRRVFVHSVRLGNE